MLRGLLSTDWMKLPCPDLIVILSLMLILKGPFAGLRFKVICPESVYKTKEWWLLIKEPVALSTNSYENFAFTPGSLIQSDLK
jgi:hypothetical protein